MNTRFKMDDGDYGEAALQNEDILTQEKTAEARRFKRATSRNFKFVRVSRLCLYYHARNVSHTRLLQRLCVVRERWSSQPR